MSLTFDFPGFHKEWAQGRQEGSAAHSGSRCTDHDAWELDLEDLSGDEAADVPGKPLAGQDEHHSQQHMTGRQQPVDFTGQHLQRLLHGSGDVNAAHHGDKRVSTSCSRVPDTVVPLLVDHLGLRDVMALACCCKAWHDCIFTGDSVLWEQQEQKLFAQGWPWPPFTGARPLQLPPSLGATSLLHLTARVNLSKVALQYFVMRKGYEFMLDGFEALWAALETSQQQQQQQPRLAGFSSGSSHSWSPTSWRSSSAAAAPAATPTSPPGAATQHPQQQGVLATAALMTVHASEDAQDAAAPAAAEACTHHTEQQRASKSGGPASHQLPLAGAGGRMQPNPITTHQALSPGRCTEPQRWQQQQAVLVTGLVSPPGTAQDADAGAAAAAAVAPAAAAAAAGGDAGGGALSGGRQLQRLVDKLAQHNWQLTYSGYSAALAARCDELAHQLADYWRQQQQPQEQSQSGEQQAATPADALASQQLEAPAAAAAAHEEGVEDRGAAAAAAAAGLLPAAVLADCAGGILGDIEAVSGGLGAGELLAGEPELLLAATRRGRRPAAAIALWRQLLTTWHTYRRWLDLVTGRCGLLGARVAAARQLAEPTAHGPPNAALLPHLRNKGLLLFRGHLLLRYGLRRPLQQAALWLAAAAAVDAPAWRAGGGCSEADLELLTAVRKLLTELDVADGQDEPAVQHTHAKFRRCFGALLTTRRRSRCLPASAW